MSGSSAPCSSAAAALDRAGVQPCGTLLWTGWTLQAGSVSVSVCVCVCVYVCVCVCVWVWTQIFFPSAIT